RLNQDEIEDGIRTLTQEVGRGLRERGYVLAAWAAKDWKKRWGGDGDGIIPPEATIFLLFERLSKPLPECSDEVLCDALVEYAFNLPDDFQATFLNSLPDNSPHREIFSELKRRNSWRSIKKSITQVIELDAGIAELWAGQQLIWDIEKIQTCDPE